MNLDFAFFFNSAMLGVGLAMDAFSVSLANGLNEPCMKKGRMAGIAGIFAFFQGLMPMIGWICVHTVVQYFQSFEKLIPWIALGLLAIGIHNLPEGIAAGVGFGTGNTGEAITIALGIALQNIPEGMVIIGPMLAAGMSHSRTFTAALLTGVVEVVGTLLGYFAVSVSAALLPFALAFAGGTMLYVISDEMIPETHHDDARGSTYFLLVGFCLMLAMDFFLG